MKELIKSFLITEDKNEMLLFASKIKTDYQKLNIANSDMLQIISETLDTYINEYDNELLRKRNISLVIQLSPLDDL